VARTESYLRAKFHLDPYNRLVRIDIGPKIVGEEELGPHPKMWGRGQSTPPLSGEVELGPYLTQILLGRGLPPYQVAC